ncbi:hypothetical protein [Nocardioides bruguierae]|uniref:Bacterial transcriptional activator domain-containing protein n=1 Tax=Nocardioides bruguierae TaxID=2945102 RepID=A0A9X2D8K0_9ACTN|nr:hypothetical protein [Nocardioides bruguierae]MCM0621273.1 hypothetical protein [Nocardioides bruguierae]
MNPPATTSAHDEQTPEQELRRGPERFAAPPPPPQRPGALRTVGAGLALLVLVVGVPLGLLALTGPPPVPTSLPDRATLTQPLSTGLVLGVLAVVVWLAWLQFTVCVVVEGVSLLREGGLPRPVPFSGRSQALARALVGTLLVGSTLLGSTGAAQAATAVAPTGPAGPAAVQVVGASSEDRQAMQDRAQDGAQDGSRATDVVEGVTLERDAAPRMQHVPGVPSDMTDVIGKKVVVVAPPDGHYHDNLWDIAERHLGDGRRWKEIFDLNQGRVQPDGEQLVLGRLIQPGWVLVVPNDATGAERVHAAAPASRGTGGPASGDRSTTGGADVSATDGAGTGVDGGVRTGADSGAVTASTGPSGALLAGGLLAASLMTALAARRRRGAGTEPDDDALEAEVALRAGADHDRVTRLDLALRSLSAACRAERVALPPVFAATVDDEAVELRVAPATTAAPAGWSVHDEGRRWRHEGAVDTEPAALGHAPYPGLVCLGRDDRDADVLVDLESVGGPLSLDGDPGVAREVLTALAAQLATAPWADEQQVLGRDLVPALGGAAGDRLRLLPDEQAVADLLDTWDRDRPARPAADVLAGRLGRHRGSAPQYLVLGGRTEPALAERLAPVAAADARGVAVLGLAPLAGARWQASVDAAGWLSLPLLDLEVDAVRVTDETAGQLAALFAAATAPAPVGAAAPARVSVDEPPHPADDAHLHAAAVRVAVLGPLEVGAQGGIDPSRLELAQELVVLLALADQPVHPSVVAASVWPRGVTPEVRDATVARTRDWLGEDADGNPLLRQTSDGRLTLSPDVAVDWVALRTLVLRARAASAADEPELLRRALRLVRGPLLARRPARRYSWLPRTRMERAAAAVVADAALRVAALTTDHDPAGVAAGCRAALRLAPHDQAVWRALLLAEHRGPEGPQAADVVDELVRVLELGGVPMDAETEALVVDLLPQRPEGAEGA